MDYYRAKSNRKRSNGSKIKQGQPKRNRFKIIKQRGTPQTVKIIDLNDDCLEKIFGHLNLRQLFNVAVSNEWLRPAACSVYHRKFGTKTVVINIVSKARKGAYPDESVHIITLDDLKTSLQFLRVFGPVITIMEMRYSLRLNCIDYQINEFCAESLVNISFYRKWDIFGFQKPFTKVKNVRIVDGNINYQLPSFVDWFPNLRRLNLHNVRLDNRYTQAFRHLVHLSIEINDRDLWVFSKIKAGELLHRNPQLQSLNIHMAERRGMTLSTLSKMVRNNSMISKLVIFTASYSTSVNTAELILFASAHPLLMELDLSLFRFSAAQVIAFMRHLNSLKWFCFMLSDCTELDVLMKQLGSEWRMTFSPEDERSTHENRRTITLEREILERDAN